MIRVNFGDRLFIYNFNATSFDHSMHPPTRKDLPHILDVEEKDKPAKDDDEKLQMSIERILLRNALATDQAKSFSQFPPSVYRRSFAATKIQRAWRRYRGRKLRAKILKEFNRAATVIQKMARLKLRKIRIIKNAAAFKIQKAWRRRLYIRKALMRCIYRRPIKELHRCATVIQRRWRYWRLYKNSPIAAKYKRPLEVLKSKVRVIVAWWLPLHEERKNRLHLQRQHRASTDIQRVFRGYYLRQLLRPDLRDKLLAVGRAVAKHRNQLHEIRGAYVLQNAWRSVMAKRVRSDKMKTRHLAAARIQALWRGYWTRSHVSMRFSYGQTIFLNAVCKALKNAHFILKMYKPCKIVCPNDRAVSSVLETYGTKPRVIEQIVEDPSEEEDQKRDSESPPPKDDQ